MNQFESDTLHLAIGLFVVFCVSFYFFRNRLSFWCSIPRFVKLSCLVWFISALVIWTALIEGLLFGFAYFVVVLTSPPLLAAGMFEVVLGVYTTVRASHNKNSCPARQHFLAGLLSIACLGAYCVTRQ